MAPTVQPHSDEELLMEEGAWEGHILQCCGNNDRRGWTTCLTSTFVPCLQFGLNANTALRRSLVKTTLTFLALMGLLVTLDYVRGFIMIGATFNHQPYPPIVRHLEGWTVAAYLAIVCYGACHRRKIRKRFNIPGNAFKDFMSWLCCFKCALCQESRTVSVRRGCQYCDAAGGCAGYSALPVHNDQMDTPFVISAPKVAKASK